MVSPIQTQIFATIEKLESLRSIHRHFEETKSQLESYEDQLSKMNFQLDKELKDIRDLEGISIKGIFHKVLGSKEEEVEKERQEYLELSLKHQEFVKEIELLEYELSVLEKKISNISILEDRLENLKKEREVEIMQSSSELRPILVEIYAKMDEVKRQKSELTEAYRAGENVRQSITMIVNYLNEASKWGEWDREWDRMSKPNYYDSKKYSSIDRAVNEAYKSRQLLALFARELKDVGINLGNINLEIGNFDGFMDRLFDNLITDWVVQNKINHALNNVQITLNHVSKLVESLKSRINQSNNEMTMLEGQKDSLLTQ